MAATTTDIDRQLKEFEEKYSFSRPDRGLNDPKAADLLWREGIPDYRLVDLSYFKGKTKNHVQGSLEQITETLVKKFEMQVTHLMKPEECSTLVPDLFRMKINGANDIDLNKMYEKGSYAVFLEGVSKELYDAAEHTYDSSQKLFQNAFTEGFAWEVLEVFSGPPKVAYTWRHWGKFSGEYKGRKGNGEILEMYGFAVATLNEESKITRVEIYYKPEGLLKCLEGKMDPSEMHGAKSLLGACCPIHRQ